MTLPLAPVIPSSPMRYLVTNFAYGYGPFLRTTELALALNAELERLGKEPFHIIVPWVYGEKQRKIMLEDFEGKGDRILLDPTLGSILKKVFYGENSYHEALTAWVDLSEQASQEAHAHLSQPKLTLQTLLGKEHVVETKHITLELTRAPRILYNIAPSYGVTFGHISEILKNLDGVSLAEVSIPRALVAKAIPIAERTEKAQERIYLAHPGTFSYKKDRTPLANEEFIPPTITPPAFLNSEYLNKGLYVTITGILGLENLYEEAQEMGLTLYSNNPDRLRGSIGVHPQVISNDAILFHFARSGWGSIWGTQLAGKGILVPEFDPGDDPEIYFNNICVEKLGLGIIYKKQPLSWLVEEMRKLKPRIVEYNASLLERFGTLDGNAYAAKMIAEQI